MNSEMLITLINNAALLILLGVFYDVLLFNNKISGPLRGAFVGFVVGLVGIALMLNPWEVFPGLFYDSRSILLSVVTLFFGFVPAVIGAIIISIYRLYIGGVGAWLNILATIAFVIIGLFWRRNHEALKKKLGIFDLYVFGLIVHVPLLVLLILLPLPLASEVLNNAALPIMLIFPLGTFLLGHLLENQLFRKKSQDILREKDKKIRNFINNVPVGFFSMTSDGEILEINHEMAKIVGLEDTKEAVNYIQNITKEAVINSNHHQKLLKMLESENYVGNFEYKTLGIDGKHIWLLLNVVKSDQIDSNIFSIDGFALDITERKEVEIAQLHAKLLAEESSRIKSEFISNMSHELRTPLTTVIGFSDLLSSEMYGKLNEKQAEYVNHINSKGNQLLNLINDILDISKIETASMELNYEHFSLSDALNFAIKNVHLTAYKKNIELLLVNEIKDDDIFADKVKFKQIMLNLLNNAIKFTPDNGKVSVKAKQTENEIQISVSDTGIGISKNMQKEIFKPFFQVDASSTRKYGGTGIGLGLVKKYVEMHEGTIVVQSESEKGSTFTFTIPLKSTPSTFPSHKSLE